jgi:hypothetical protein
MNDTFYICLSIVGLIIIVLGLAAIPFILWLSPSDSLSSFIVGDGIIVGLGISIGLIISVEKDCCKEQRINEQSKKLD